MVKKCLICNCKINKNKHITLSLLCKHEFHYNCFNEHVKLNIECPECFRKLEFAEIYREEIDDGLFNDIYKMMNIKICENEINNSKN